MDNEKFEAGEQALFEAEGQAPIFADEAAEAAPATDEPETVTDDAPVPDEPEAAVSEPEATDAPEATDDTPATDEPEAAVSEPEAVADDVPPQSGLVRALKERGPILAIVAVAAVAVILLCNLLFKPAASPVDEVLRYVDPLPANETDVAMETVGIAGDTTLLTVDGAAVTAEEYLYWLGNITSYYDMISSYSGSELDFTREAQEGVTWDEQLKLSARDNAVLLALVPTLAKEQGVELTEEDFRSVADSRASGIENAGGEAMYAYQLQAMGINDVTAIRLSATTQLYTKFQEAWMDKTVSALTAEDVNAYAEENDLLRAKHILLMTIDPTTREPLDEEAVAAKRAKAEEILAQVQADPTRFDQLMNDNSEDGGLQSNPNGYLFTAGEMVEPFETATRALEFDQISGIVESDYGYHIILRLSPDCDETRQNVATQRFNDMIQSRVDEAKVKESAAYAGITTADYYEKLTAFQKALPAPETEEAPEAEPTPEVVDQSQAELEPDSAADDGQGADPAPPAS